ncbi:required for meiotic nuclear division protein 1 homolog [Asterias amurensis]|uniref:required for meiotic nuclear division protein 1 homolog n=1 Tax=Asterias amurensis TaxID=7602 RepID=UPI003AB63024
MASANLLARLCIACCNHSQKHSSSFLSMTQRFPGTILLRCGERTFSSNEVLLRLRGRQCRDDIANHNHPQLQTITSSRCFSILSKCARVEARCLQSNNKIIVSQTTRAKYSQSDDEESPIVFVSKSPSLIGRKTTRKMQSVVPTAPVVLRSRTKKPTRLGVREKKDSWLCTAFSTAEEYQLEHLSLDLQSQGPFKPITMPQDAQDILLMEVLSSDADEDKTEPSQVFFFREGSVVFWNVPDSKLKKILQTISKHEFRPYEVALVTWENEHINFTYGSQGTKLTEDAFILDENKDTEAVTLEKFAFSNAMALSVKLSIWEAYVDKFTSSLEHIPEGLKRGHRLKMSRVEVLRKTGELFSLRHQINLSSDLLISPDFYWDRDGLDALYNKTCQFYSIGRRTRVTNEKLNHCSELVELVRTHLSEHHSLKLEWMIILLILVEVIFEVIHYIQRYLEKESPAHPAEIASGINNQALDGRR